MSLYSEYLAACGHLDIIEHDTGFATFKLMGTECYLVDIYVKPEWRVKGVARQLADEVVGVAKAAGCKYLTGSVNTAIKDPTSSLKVLLAYGFRFWKAEPHILWFCKEIA